MILRYLVVAVLLIGQSTAVQAAEQSKAPNQALAHIGHILDAWLDTPGRWGLLPTAERDADVARRHAALAISAPDDLAAIQTHIRHVLNAIDPAVENKGPGTGYGLIRAAAAISAHATLAARAPDASDTVKLHAKHVIASIDTVVERCQKVIALGQQILAEKAAAPALKKAYGVLQQVEWILTGHDVNGDGTISWDGGEGGLAQVRKHVAYMKQGEGR
jgi:hypothetical protein